MLRDLLDFAESCSLQHVVFYARVLLPCLYFYICYHARRHWECMWPCGGFHVVALSTYCVGFSYVDTDCHTVDCVAPVLLFQRKTWVGPIAFVFESTDCIIDIHGVRYKLKFYLLWSCFWVRNIFSCMNHLPFIAYIFDERSILAYSNGVSTCYSQTERCKMSPRLSIIAWHRRPATRGLCPPKKVRPSSPHYYTQPAPSHLAPSAPRPSALPDPGGSDKTRVQSCW